MKSKKLIIVLAALLIVSSIGFTFGDSIFSTIKVGVNKDNNIMYNGKNITPIVNKMFIYEGTSYVPLKEMLVLMGKNVTWNQEKRAVTVMDKVDTFTSASVVNFYESSALKGEALFTALRNRDTAITVATVNPDGTPNAAVVIPGVVNETTLQFGLADNQTKLNLQNDKRAVITAYIYSPKAVSKADRNIGAKLQVELITDAAELKTLFETTKAPVGTIFVKIIKIMPLG